MVKLIRTTLFLIHCGFYGWPMPYSPFIFGSGGNGWWLLSVTRHYSELGSTRDLMWTQLCKGLVKAAASLEFHTPPWPLTGERPHTPSRHPAERHLQGGRRSDTRLTVRDPLPRLYWHPCTATLTPNSHQKLGEVWWGRGRGDGYEGSLSIPTRYRTVCLTRRSNLASQPRPDQEGRKCSCEGNLQASCHGSCEADMATEKLHSQAGHDPPNSRKQPDCYVRDGTVPRTYSNSSDASSRMVKRGAKRKRKPLCHRRMHHERGRGLIRTPLGDDWLPDCSPKGR